MTPENTDRYIEFREPRTIVELEEMLKLRYAVRRSCHLAALCPENEAQIDIDEFDRYAYHVGLFALENHRFVPVGYSRFVLDHPGPQARWVELIARRNKLTEKISEPAVLFPCLKYVPTEYADKVTSLHQRATSEGKTMGESSGTVLHPDIRSLKTASRWVEAIVGYCMIWKQISYGTMTVSDHHAPFYFRFGFKPLEGTTAFWASFSAGVALCLEHLPQDEPRTAGVFRSAHEFAATGKVVICGNRTPKVTLHHSPLQERTQLCAHA